MDSFIVKQDKMGKKGLFATKTFSKNQVLFEFIGAKILYHEIFQQKISSDISDRFLQIGENLFLDLQDHYSVFCNHSCNPNCFVKIHTNRAFLVSEREIKIGDELVLDYSLTSTENEYSWNIPCNCDPWVCRKNISGWHSLSAERQKYYTDRNMVPDFVLGKNLPSY